LPTQQLPWLQHSHLAHWTGVHRLDIARWYLGQEVARVQLKQLIANLHRKRAREDEEGIVLLMMKVQWRALQISDGCLHEVKAAIYICTRDPKRPWIRSNHDGLLALSFSDDQR
jgi:hypothetical protein